MKIKYVAQCFIWKCAHLMQKENQANSLGGKTCILINQCLIIDYVSFSNHFRNTQAVFPQQTLCIHKWAHQSRKIENPFSRKSETAAIKEQLRVS